LIVMVDCRCGNGEIRHAPRTLSESGSVVGPMPRPENSACATASARCRYRRKLGVDRRKELLATHRAGGEHAAVTESPAHGSQPGAQAGRHALEGRGNEGTVARLSSIGSGHTRPFTDRTRRADPAHRSKVAMRTTHHAQPANSSDKERTPTEIKARTLPELSKLYIPCKFRQLYLRRREWRFHRNMIDSIDLSILRKLYFGGFSSVVRP
jgi:hypothetical protein